MAFVLNHRPRKAIAAESAQMTLLDPPCRNVANQDVSSRCALVRA